MSNRPTIKDILSAIEQQCGDDWSEMLDMQDASEPLTGDLKEAHSRLSAIYRIAHSFNKSHCCYHVHGNWRSAVKVERLSDAPVATEATA